MKDMHFTVEIHASKETVWDVLWQDQTFRQWAGLIDPGTYMVGELKPGKEVQFISAENGYGVTSLVAELVPNESLVLKHRADTKESGTKERENEWTGGTESYELVEKGGVTTLKVTFDVPEDMEEYFAGNYPKALNCVKLLAEAS